MTTREIRNWNSTVFSRPAVVACPGSVGDLVAVVRDTGRYPSPVRAIGHLHSLNACFASTGTQVMMDAFDGIQVDLDRATITVGASVSLTQIRDALRPHGYQIEVTPEIGNASAGSVACCGTKDSSVGRAGLGQISSTVVGVKLVNPRGEVEEIAAGANPDRLRVLRSSYGLLGIVFEVTFRIQPLVLLHYDYQVISLDPPPAIADIFGGADAVLGFALPYRRRMIAERRVVIDTGTAITRFDELKRRIRDRNWENGASFLTTALPRNGWFDVFDRLVAGGFRLTSALGGFRAHRGDSMIDFQWRRRHYFDFTFWALPLSAWERAVPAYLDFCERFRRESGFRAALATEVYFVRRDDAALLSFSPDEDVFTLDLADSRPNDPAWERMNRAFNQLAAEAGGRPILSQTKWLDRAIVHQTLGQAWQRFLAIRAEEDPAGRFLNAYFEALI